MYFSRSFLVYSLIIMLCIVPIISLSTEVSSDLDDIDDKREGRSWRLPNTSYPLKYHLHITTWIHREVFDFTGNVTIELMIKESTSELVLHAKDLGIQKIFIQDLTTKQQISNLKSRIIDDLLVISVENRTDRKDANVFISDHRLRLEIHYSGIIKENNAGFQINTYENKKKKIVYGAFTQMEPISARKALPCYDEPGLKAKFNVRITHGSNYTAISNMPNITMIKHDADNMITTIFQETPIMCTYILAFQVSNFEFISEESEGILHRVFRPPNTEDRGELALANSIKAVKAFGRYMDIPYSLPKIDHVDINSFQFDGMENWGLITYDSFSFLKGKQIKNFKQVITQHHEIVHQWFGNLVSPMWWDSTWLNEGFATLYSYKLTEMIYPKLNAMKFFSLDNCYYDVNHAINKYVEEPEDIDSMFGLSSYNKASCLLNMFSNIIENGVFDRGVKDFLKTHAYSNANGDQLFQHLQNAIDNSNETIWKLNVSEVMKPWFTKEKEPELFVTRNYSNPNIINIKQKPREDESFWWLPLHFGKITDKKTDSITYYMPPIEEVTLDLSKFNIELGKDDALDVTIPGITSYMVNYDNENTLRIAKALQQDPNRINAMQRVVSLRSITKMWTEQSSIVPKLELLKYLRKEKDVHVWTAISNRLLNFSNMLYATDTKLNKEFKEFMRNIIAKHYMKYEKRTGQKLLGKETQMLSAMRSLACNFHLNECLTQSRQRFLEQKKRRNNSNIKLHNPSDICYAAKAFTNREFVNTLKYLKNLDVNSKTMYWRFLRCTDSEEQYGEFLRKLSDIPNAKVVTKRHLIFWADLLTLAAADVMKWNLTYKFLMEEIPKLQKFPNATNILCTRMGNKAEDIRPQFQAQYINLMNQCSKEMFVKGPAFANKKEMINLKRIGANYLFQNSPLWQRNIQEAHKWLESEK